MRYFKVGDTVRADVNSSFYTKVKRGKCYDVVELPKSHPSIMYIELKEGVRESVYMKDFTSIKAKTKTYLIY